MSEHYFPDESKAALSALLQEVEQAAGEVAATSETQLMTDALILPFASALGCVQLSHNPAHVKDEGGIGVFTDWYLQFRRYLSELADLLGQLPPPSHGETCSNETLFGDARLVELPQQSFDAIFTSPPYPNRADYAALFLPELHFLNWRRRESSARLRDRVGDLVGTVTVRTNKDSLQGPVSRAARRFIDRAEDAAREKGPAAASAQNRYYTPYFSSYFSGVESLWENVAPALSDDVRGFVVVVDNTHRGMVVPVADFCLETWRRLGLRASVHETSENTHVGTQNPRARGVRAVHKRTVIRIEGRA